MPRRATPLLLLACAALGDAFFSRDGGLSWTMARAGSHISIGKATATACEVTPSVKLETYWEYKEFVRGGGYLGDGSW